MELMVPGIQVKEAHYSPQEKANKIETLFTSKETDLGRMEAVCIGTHQSAQETKSQ